LKFKNKAVLVTGGTRGIGAACVKAFLSEGARVAVNGRSEDSVNRSLKTFDGDAFPAPGEISTAVGCQDVVNAALDHLGRLDILVNNAGVFYRRPIEQTDETIWDDVMDTNVKGLYFCTRHSLPALRNAKGSVINMASESGLNGYPLTSAYCASKGAVVNLTRSMAMELAPDVRVNAICPGIIDTDMARDGFAINGDKDEGMRQQRLSYPLQRIGTVEQIASAALYLASPDADFITGAAIPIEGGATAGRW